jgi:hypothetical protein
MDIYAILTIINISSYPTLTYTSRATRKIRLMYKLVAGIKNIKGNDFTFVCRVLTQGLTLLSSFCFLCIAFREENNSFHRGLISLGTIPSYALLSSRIRNRDGTRVPHTLARMVSAHAARNPIPEVLTGSLHAPVLVRRIAWARGLDREVELEGTLRDLRLVREPTRPQV